MASTLARINLDYLLRNAPTPVVRRGSLYYHDGRVWVIEADEEQATLAIQGSRPEPYEVVVALHHETSEYLTLRCDCPYADEHPGEWCKHKVAAILKMRDHYKVARTVRWQEVLTDAAGRSRDAGSPVRYAIAFSLQRGASLWRLVPYLLTGRQLGSIETWDSAGVAESLDAGGLRARLLAIWPSDDHTIHGTLPQTGVARILISEEPNSRFGQDQLTAGALEMVRGGFVYKGTRDQPFAQPLEVSDHTAEPVLTLSRCDGGMRLTLELQYGAHTVVPRPDDVVAPDARRPWILDAGTLVRLEDNGRLTKALVHHQGLMIPEEEEDAFFEQYLGGLADQARLIGDAVGEWRDIVENCVSRVYLSETRTDLTAEIRFAYGEAELPFDPGFPTLSLRRSPDRRSVVRIRRDPSVERESWRALSGFGLKRSHAPGVFLIRSTVTPADFLLGQIPKLGASGYEVYGEERLRSVRVNRSQPSISFAVSSGIDWFDLRADIMFGDTRASLKDVRRAVRRRERYVKLMDGSIGQIPEEWLEKYQHLFGAGTQNEEGLLFSNAQMVILDRVLQDEDQAVADAEFRERLSRLRGFEAIQARPLPDGLTGRLRPYQQHGYDWLQFLREYRFGGCLADDMGLGKTVQALAFLLSLKDERPRRPSLVVVRKSLLTNWQREAARFAPELTILQHTEGDRVQNADALRKRDVVLTTYGIMLRDIEILSQRDFRCIILDESQAIKNPNALTSRAARQLKGVYRLALTGTPVENSTVELWSLFAFLNPGLLGSLDHFRREFVGPIERKNDEVTAEYLRSLIHPFILRRTKEQVAPELPARTERIVLCELDQAQRRIYDTYRERYRSLLLGLIEEKGMQGARMRILEGLLRLRQICIHPRLVEASYRGSAAKMDVLMETLETLQAEGHKALVFSQFTQMLRLVKSSLAERHIPHQYLDGQTSNRQERIDAFQADPSIPFFLVSLKAGGVGLNLTVADYVVHIDPWWNPAVERQASDRTHRIGQDKPVFVHKLIARDTVEEKMLELQERKRTLVEKLVSSESAFFKSLTASDVQALFS